MMLSNMKSTNGELLEVWGMPYTGDKRSRKPFNGKEVILELRRESLRRQVRKIIGSK